MCCGILHSNRGHPLIPNSLSYAVPTARLPIHCAYAFPFSIRFALYPVRKPLVYSAKLIAGCRPCQGPLLAGWRKIFLPGLNGECIFRILLAVYKAFKVGANLNYRNLNRDLVKANTVTVGPELAYYALKGRKFSLLGIAAGTIGYQKAKAKSDLVYLEKSKAFVYGYEVGIRPEMLLSPKVALFAEYRFEMLFNSILRNNNHVGLGCVIYL